jgi:adenosylmethionine-8-amino-7-oxononanoate aminotransferase
MIKLAKQYNVLTIADEVFTGFGRTGKYFASNHLSEDPDIMCLSKALTGGFLPLGLTAVSQEVYNGFYSDEPSHTFLHGHSYTGNPLACCAANASLDLFENDNVWKRISSIEQSFIEFTSEISSFNNVRAVRSLGAIAVIEIEGGGKSSYFNTIGKKFYNELLKEGVILRPLGNTIVVVPPYCIEDDQLVKLYDAIKQTLKNI